MSKPKHDNKTKQHDVLLNTLKGQPVTKTPAKEATAKTLPSGRGKCVSLYLHDADRERIQYLMSYLSGQGKRANESLAIKTALRAAKPGPDLLKAWEEASRQDQRFTKT